MLTKQPNCNVSWTRRVPLSRMTRPTLRPVIKDLAIQRFAAYQHDQPFAARGQSFANAFVNSGAASVLSRWRIRRL